MQNLKKENQARLLLCWIGDMKLEYDNALLYVLYMRTGELKCCLVQCN